MQLAGQHCLLDVSGIDIEWAKDAVRIEALLREVAHAAGATIINSHFHTFGAGGGVTGVLLLAESHISIHTWPEHAYAALDIFMCGSHQIELALCLLKSKMQSDFININMINRGLPTNLN
ncbi:MULTISPECIES: adenosylmethionine decarboxylase [Vitreoscilla]|uniref:S-adenosylmethionine decarboxylase proenzyme n=1 Tax=Vitreoscilla stercoraria TaxID=61 RepID=A0ABY4EFL9_VITST|nr:MULTISPECIES: adenosylmethionine decarboxylase [Vitreoscilla]AUZ03887.1 S-adenosylmethionine decarboxylase proenzyme [Vitreoscilla sp. C1]UOO92187.1 adenosylmethionine decarboxylase [Vitreoscilla stercoraria]